ncbi:TPA: hypothetical protein ACLQU7_005704 [Bacillus tropicus]|uniref:hypothetical protein n=1 Tax=Bacillus cereus group TaxID=86661 RepID=UPI00003CB59E|nr:MULTISPECIES: hypothetical protein [Bacillus cereus group]AIY72965.1 hypothetical protein NT98_5833 [Bacillus cereus]AJI07972.1 hypothetical protein AQ16_5552 [Bacillus cereus G9241]EAL15929.1 hypothetical protein protein [Bacillus cereus G9241]QPS53561.1 hypothetical protein I6G54_28700 [Bacillus tropicus]
MYGKNEKVVLDHGHQLILGEGITRESFPILEGQDLVFPNLSKKLKEAKYSNKKEHYRINGYVKVIDKEKTETTHSNKIVDNITVYHMAKFFVQKQDGSLQQLGKFVEQEFGYKKVGSKIDLERIKYLAQQELKFLYPDKNYQIKSRRYAASRILTNSPFNTNEDEFLTDKFVHFIRPQFKDINVDEYVELIFEEYYVEEN